MRYGKVQIYCTEGIIIKLNSKKIAESNTKENGKLLKNIPEGEQIFEFVKPGFFEKIITLNVRAGEVEQINIREQKTSLTFEQSGEPPEPTSVKLEQKLGSLKISTIPTKCDIILKKENIKKEKNELFIKEIPIGSYFIEFTNESQGILTEVQIIESITKEIQIDFDEIKVICLNSKNRFVIIELINFPQSESWIDRDNESIVHKSEFFINDNNEQPVVSRFPVKNDYMNNVITNYKIPKKINHLFIEPRTQLHFFLRTEKNYGSSYNKESNILTLNNLSPGEKITIEFKENKIITKSRSNLC